MTNNQSKEIVDKKKIEYNKSEIYHFKCGNSDIFCIGKTKINFNVNYKEHILSCN